MWFDIPEELPDWTPALRHLSKVDPVMKKVIERVGPCTLAPRGDPFVALCQAIFTQQVSTAVANSFGVLTPLSDTGSRFGAVAVCMLSPSGHLKSGRLYR